MRKTADYVKTCHHLTIYETDGWEEGNRPLGESPTLEHKQNLNSETTSMSA